MNETATKHGKYIADFSKGVFYPNIEKDPRDSTLPDEKTDLTSLPNYTPGLDKRQKTFIEKEVNEQTTNPKVDKYVQKVVDIARQTKINLAERKMA